MPKKSKTLCVDDLRHAEYYGMQGTFDELYQKSQNGEVFENLMDLILSRDNILLAYRNIKANKGSYTAGTDKKNITDIGSQTPDDVVKRVRFIVTGSKHGYRPKPVRRKDIPKPNGKTRPLGIPCIWDRLIQQCIKQIMEPICEEMHIIRYADDFRIFCRTKEDAVRTKEAVTAWIEERLKLEVSPEKTRIVNTRKRWSEFLGFKIRVRLKHHKYVVQSAICDKKVEIERAKLVEQAKNIAKPREKKSCLSEIQLYNSMVLGIQNYYQLATCISIDCREFHRRVMTVLTNRLNTETGSMLKREGGTITQAEKERFGQSKMIRYVSGIDQMIYPIAFIKNKIPMAKRSIVCSYTKEGRAPIHTELNLNQYVLKGLREKISVGHSTEYHDSKISLFSAQKGKCAISGEEFADAEHVAVWLKVPRALGGFERYKNMVLIHQKYLILLQELPQAVIKDLIKTLNITKKMLVKINSLREQANLSAII